MVNYNTKCGFVIVAWVSGIPEEYLAQGQKCQFLCELVYEHAFWNVVVIQEGQWQDQIQIQQIEKLNVNRTKLVPCVWSI